MSRLGRGALALAALLALIAGFVDAVGFLELGGFFLSFMSGNSTRLGVGLGHDDLENAARAASLIGLFVAGVTAAALTPGTARFRKPGLLLATAGVLAAAAAVSGERPVLAGGLAAFAMGALNILFQKDGEISFGVTYMTGSLVRLGSNLAAALKGGPRWAFAPYLLLWVAMATGALLGSVSHHFVASNAFWLASGACAVAAALTLGLRPDVPSPIPVLPESGAKAPKPTTE